MSSPISFIKLSQYFIFILTFLIIGILGCQKDPVGVDDRERPDDIPEGSWRTYSPYDWTHDGDPYFAENCIVYSDGCSYEFKEQVGNFADQRFVEVLNLFDFEDRNDFLYPMDYEKVDVYINRNHPERIAAAYWGSIIITFSSESLLSGHDYLFKHELTHQFQFLIEGNVNLSTPVWFTEGIAIYGGGSRWGIRTISDLDRWIAANSNDPNQGNPIYINVWNDFPPGADIAGYYTNVFDLTMRYFLDPEGLNKSTGDVLHLFYDLRNDTPFGYSFQEHFGLDVQEFKEDYYVQMREYLENIN